MQRTAFKARRSRVRIRGSSLAAPLLTYNVARGTWTLEETYAAHDGTWTLTIAAPFEFDLATIPRFVWSLIAPFELSIVAPLVHDFLYLSAGDPAAGSIVPPRRYTRLETDRLFRRHMQSEGVSAWRRNLGFAAVRVFGGRYWGTPLGVRPPP